MGLAERFVPKGLGPIGSRIEALQERWNLQLVLATGGAAALLLIIAVIGAFTVGHGGKHAGKGRLSEVNAAAPGGETPTSVAGGPAVTSPGATGAATTKPGSRAGGAAAGGLPVTATGLASTPGATRVGVFPDHVLWGLHAPQTFDGKPLSLAADPLEGVGIYLTALNNSGGINGRKIEEVFADDRYTTDGASQAADKLINDAHVFHISGTLGVDQVAVVAKRASQTKPAPTPYMAAGASERAFKAEGIQMFQIGGSYDTHLKELVHFLAQESAKPPGQSIYSGKKRIAVSVLDSKYIIDPVNAMADVVKSTPGLEWAGYVTVPKFTDPNNTHNYSTQIQQLKQMRADIVVPAQDPLTTGLETQQCVAQGCAFKWTFSDFAHDEDIALQLQGGGPPWAGVRGLSGGCYYQDYNKGFNCAQLRAAHDAWVSVKSESDWQQHGQSGVAGYQVVHFWIAAMRNAGADLTRERFVAAMNAYSNYDDLVTGPITFAGSPNTVHGIELMAVYEGQSNGHWKMISNGLVGPF